MNKGKLFVRSLISAFVICMITYAFPYFNLTLNNDRYSLTGDTSAGKYKGWFYPGISEKWFSATGQSLTLRTYMPWIDGVWTILLMSVCVYLTCRIFKISGTLYIWLICGFYSLDYAIVTGHFYTPYTFVMALMFSLLAVWAWQLECIRWWQRIILSAGFTALCLGTYGAYASVSSTIVILISIGLLAAGRSVSRVFTRGIEFIAAFALGGAVDYAILRIKVHVKNTVIQSYGGESNIMDGGLSNIRTIFDNALIGYRSAVEWLVKGRTMMSQFVALTLLISGLVMAGVLLYRNRKKVDGVLAWLLMGALVLVYPLSAGLIYVLAFNTVHWLMKFTAVIIYIGFIKCLELTLADLDLKTIFNGPDKEHGRSSEISVETNPGTEENITDSLKYCIKRLGQSCRNNIAGYIAAVVMITVSVGFMYNSVLTANLAFVRYENIYEVTKSNVNRLLTHIEECEGYTGEEQIIFYGFITNNNYIYSSRYKDNTNVITRLDDFPFVNKEKTNAFHHPVQFFYFTYAVTDFNPDIQYYNPNGVTIPDDELKVAEEMPIYPATGSIRKVSDEHIVVKLDDYWGW